MASEATTLTVAPRALEGSRANRRLRRSGRVPGVLYGGGDEPVHFSVDARELRIALHQAGAVVELELDGDRTPALLKEQQRDPVRGDPVHVDFIRVRLDRPVQAAVILELTGAEDAPGAADGVLEQQTREVTVEALPGDLPDVIAHDVSALEAGATVHLSDIDTPPGVTIVDDPETVVASITLPRLEVETPEAPETETEVVGEGEGEAFSPAAGAGEAPQAGGGAASDEG